MARISYANPDDLQNPELREALHASLDNYEKTPLSGLVSMRAEDR